MSEEQKATLIKVIKYSVASLIGLGLAVVILFYKEFWTEESLLERYRILADAFTVPAVLYIALGALVWIANNEGFVGLGYLFNFALRAIVPGLGLKKDETYAEYRERVTSREKNKGFGMFFIVGGVFAVVMVVFLILFYSLYQ